MKSVSIQTSVRDIYRHISKLKAIDSQIIFIFSSNDILENSFIIEALRKEMPQARLMGCSTSGEIGNSIEDNSVTLLGLHFDKTRYEFTSVPLTHMEQSYDVGNAVAKNLLKDDLKAIFLLAPGVNINGSEITKGMKDALPGNVSVSGGMAGDGLMFEKTYVLLDDHVSDTQAVALGLYGEHIHVKCASNGGWKPFGPLRRVTKADKNILCELDGKPALALYKEYLGDKTAGLPTSGLFYPMAIMQGWDQGKDQSGLIRTVYGIDEKTNCIVLGGNVETGSILSLMYAGTPELAEGARMAAEKALEGQAPNTDSAAICVSCVGRRLVMGGDTEEELDAVRACLKDVPIAGFYSNGEICHQEGTNQPEFFNQTMTITYIAEK